MSGGKTDDLCRRTPPLHALRAIAVRVEAKGTSAMLDDEANRTGPAHGLTASDVVSAQTKEAVLDVMRTVEQMIVSVACQPVADVNHPHGRDRHTEQKHVQAGGMVDMTTFQIETVAFPVSKCGFNPETFTSSSPGLSICRQVNAPIEGIFPFGVPIANQIDRAKAV